MTRVRTRTGRSGPGPWIVSGVSRFFQRYFEGNGFEFGDLNTAMMAAIMAEQIARSKRLEEAEQLKRLQRLEELERLKQQTIEAQQRLKVN